jgi:hypothetical protein
MLKKKVLKKDQVDVNLLERSNQIINNAIKNKENLSMLERMIDSNNDLIKLNRKKRKAVPARVDVEKKDILENVLPYDEKYEKLIHYAEKYRIPFSRAGFKKTYKDLAEDIHKYEMKNTKLLVKNGLDKKYREYGHYISIV